MKPQLNSGVVRTLLALLCWLVVSGPLVAALPVPSFVYYGEVIDAYGWPVTSDAEAYVIARSGGNECARAMLHEGRGPAINYRIEIPVDDGSGDPYVTHAVRPGATVVFTVLVDGAETAVMDPAAVPTVGEPGGLIRHNLCTGQDGDGDGLPDAWENWIIASGTSAATNIAGILGSDDSDGDGMNNRDEFLAGTDPAWDVDLLRIEEFRFVEGTDRVGVAFYSVPGKTYRVRSRAAMQQAAADVSDVGPDEAGNAGAAYWRGDGYYSWLYLDASTNASAFLQLQVE